MPASTFLLFVNMENIECNQVYNDRLWFSFSRKPGGTSYNSLYGEAPPEKGIFFRLQVNKSVVVSLV